MNDTTMELALPRTARAYDPEDGVVAFARKVAAATPMQLIELERAGVPAGLLKDLARALGIAAVRLFAMLGIPKATAEKKIASDGTLTGAAGCAALGMVRLIGVAQDIVDNSTAPDAQGFDAARWLGRWIERPQQPLGGLAPAQLLDTPSGLEAVARVLGAAQSGAYL